MAAAPAAEEEDPNMAEEEGAVLDVFVEGGMLIVRPPESGSCVFPPVLRRARAGIP